MLEEAAKASTLKQMQIPLKAQLYASAFSRGMQTYEENGSTSGFDILLDKVFFDNLRDAYESFA